MILKPDARPKWWCRIFGHKVRTEQSPQIESHMSGNYWFWPGVATYCSRCGLIFRTREGPARFRDRLSGREFTELDTRAGLNP